MSLERRRCSNRSAPSTALHNVESTGNLAGARSRDTLHTRPGRSGWDAPYRSGRCGLGISGMVAGFAAMVCSPCADDTMAAVIRRCADLPCDLLNFHGFHGASLSEEGRARRDVPPTPSRFGAHNNNNNASLAHAATCDQQALRPHCRGMEEFFAPKPRPGETATTRAGASGPTLQRALSMRGVSNKAGAAQRFCVYRNGFHECD